MKEKNLNENYEKYTDKYFLRARQILESEGINPKVRYQIFARIPGIVKGMSDAVNFIKSMTGDRAKIYALRDGQEYNACEPLMKLEGRVQDLVELETIYLGLLAGELTGNIDMVEVRKKARNIKNAAEDKAVLYFGARHFAPELDERIAKICQEEGFVGCSTDIGARAWNTKGEGTIPHALILSYNAYLRENNIEGNATVEAAKGFDRNISESVPRIVLIDTFNREITDSLETAVALPNLAGVRIDTCGENYAQGSRETENKLSKLDIAGKYLRGKGVTIAGTWALRKALVENEYKNISLVVSSGFNAEKTTAFMKADKIFQQKYNIPLFTAIGTGSISNPIMTTSDIVAYFSEKYDKWLPNSKVGRYEIESKRLEEIK